MAYADVGLNSSRPAPNTYVNLEVDLQPGNLMGIAPGRHNIVLAGWKVPCDPAVIYRLHVGICVKVSGFIPGGPQKPEPDEYAVNGKIGCQPHLLEYPIAHAHFWKGTKILAASVRHCWEQGMTALFHCNRGEVRAQWPLRSSWAQ